MLHATPKEVFETWMSSAKHSDFTKSEANIVPKVGGRFTTFDGWASGITVELEPGKKIVQDWRAHDWPKGHFSTLTIRFIKAPKGTKVVFTQVNVPADTAKDVARGWNNYYWNAMKERFGW